MGKNVTVAIESDVADQVQGDVGAVHRLVCALGRLLAIDKLIQDREYSELSQAISKFLRFVGFVSFDADLTPDEPELLDSATSAEER
jgi:hypothetical protein